MTTAAAMASHPRSSLSPPVAVFPLQTATPELQSKPQVATVHRHCSSPSSPPSKLLVSPELAIDLAAVEHQNPFSPPPATSVCASATSGVAASSPSPINAAPHPVAPSSPIGGRSPPSAQMINMETEQLCISSEKEFRVIVFESSGCRLPSPTVASSMEAATMSGSAAVSTPVCAPVMEDEVVGSSMPTGGSVSTVGGEKAVGGEGVAGLLPPSRLSAVVQTITDHKLLRHSPQSCHHC